MKSFSDIIHRPTPFGLTDHPEITGFQLVHEWTDQGYKHQFFVGLPYALDKEADARADARKLNKEAKGMIGRYKVYRCHSQTVTVEFVRLLK